MSYGVKNGRELASGAKSISGSVRIGPRDEDIPKYNGWGIYHREASP
jgi:hypothetical protein